MSVGKRGSQVTMIIGIDPGTHLAGYATSDGSIADAWQLKGSMTSRMAELYGRVFALCQKYPAATFAVEVPVGGFQGNGARELYAVGVIFAALGHFDRDVITVNPSEAKTALAGVGNADKAQMMSVAQMLHIGQADEYYWLDKLNPRYEQYTGCQKGPKYLSLARDMAATVADAYGIALAGMGKVARS